MDEATAHVSHAAQLYDRLTGSGLGTVILLQAQTAYLRGTFAQAEMLAHKALYMADALEQHLVRLMCALCLLAQGESQQARTHFAAAVAGCAADGLWLIPAEFAAANTGMIEEAAQAHGAGATRLAELSGRFEEKSPRLLKTIRHIDFLQALSLRERAVARLAAQGMSNCAVAEQLHIAECTVKTHLTHIYSKLAIRNRTELAASIRPGT